VARPGLSWIACCSTHVGIAIAGGKDGGGLIALYFLRMARAAVEPIREKASIYASRFRAFATFDSFLVLVLEGEVQTNLTEHSKRRKSLWQLGMKKVQRVAKGL